MVLKSSKHGVLCVDDEQNILNALKRLLRRERYSLFTANSGSEGLEILANNEIHLVMSDQRMPEMSGTDFLAVVKEKYPDTVRTVLSGYTEVDTITEAINKGHVYKFFLKPWNDQSLLLEIRQALKQYDLIQANRSLDKKILEQNEELKTINENLETLVKERTFELEIQNQALELSHAVLEEVSVAIVGVSSDGIVALTNQKARSLPFKAGSIDVGRQIENYVSVDVKKSVSEALENGTAQIVQEKAHLDNCHHVTVTPLSGRFRGRGAIITFEPDT